MAVAKTLPGETNKLVFSPEETKSKGRGVKRKDILLNKGVDKGGEDGNKKNRIQIGLSNRDQEEEEEVRLLDNERIDANEKEKDKEESKEEKLSNVEKMKEEIEIKRDDDDDDDNNSSNDEESEEDEEIIMARLLQEEEIDKLLIEKDELQRAKCKWIRGRSKNLKPPNITWTNNEETEIAIRKSRLGSILIDDMLDKVLTFLWNPSEANDVIFDFRHIRHPAILSWIVTKMIKLTNRITKLNHITVQVGPQDIPRIYPNILEGYMLNDSTPVEVARKEELTLAGRYQQEEQKIYKKIEVMFELKDYDRHRAIILNGDRRTLLIKYSVRLDRYDKNLRPPFARPPYKYNAWTRMLDELIHRRGTTVGLPQIIFTFANKIRFEHVLFQEEKEEYAKCGGNIDYIFGQRSPDIVFTDKTFTFGEFVENCYRAKDRMFEKYWETFERAILMPPTPDGILHFKLVYVRNAHAWPDRSRLPTVVPSIFLLRHDLEDHFAYNKRDKKRHQYLHDEGYL
jgi:hypothetical protein